MKLTTIGAPVHTDAPGAEDHSMLCHIRRRLTCFVRPKNIIGKPSTVRQTTEWKQRLEFEGSMLGAPSATPATASSVA
jgi:hypothetical protein